MAINKEYNDIQLDVKFTQASTRANLVSEENISVSFGKISKYFADLHSQAFTGYKHPTHTAYSSGLYKITVDELGHVTSAATVTGSDLPAHEHPYLPLAGGTLTGRVTTSKFLNYVVKGTGTAGADKGSGQNPRYVPAKWTFNTGQTVSDGDVIIIKIPVAGHDYGVYISIDNGTTYHPVVISGSSRLTTHYGNGNYAVFTFRGDGSASSMIPLAGNTDGARVTVTGGVWQGIDYYDSGNTYDRTSQQTRIYAGGVGVFRYSICGLNSAQRMESFTTTGDASGSPTTTKTFNTSAKFSYPPVIMYNNANAVYSSGGVIGNNVLYEQFPSLDMRYSCNKTSSASTGFTQYKPVFIECTFDDDGFWSITSNGFVQTFTSGKYYILVGCMYNTSVYQLAMFAQHPVYYYDGTNLTMVPFTKAEKTKLAGISEGANKTEASSNNGKIKIDGIDTTVYTHPSHTSKTSGLYKITVDSTGHVSETASVTTSDIPAFPLSIAADSGTNQLTLSASTKYKLTAGGSTFVFTTPSHPTITKSADTTSTASPGHGETFTVVDSVTREANGHVTKINTKTVTLPADSNTDTKVTQSSSTTSDFRPLLLGKNNQTNPENLETTVTDQTYVTKHVFVQPSTGNLTLYNASGDSPSLIFRRGTMIDNTLEWRIQNVGGKLNFDRDKNESTETWENIFQLDPTNNKMYFKNTEVSLSGHTHNYAGSTTVGGAATNIATTVTNGVSVGSTYYGVIFAADPNTSGGYPARKNDDFKYGHVDGTASSAGYAEIILGNNKDSTTAGNKRGVLTLYSKGTSYHSIETTETSTSVKHTLPATTGTILNSGTTSFTQTLSSGTKIGTIKINGTSTDLYCETNTNTDTKVTQTNTTTSADYRVLLSGNANDTTETTTGRKSVNLRFNPSSGGLYSFGFLWTDITGLTLDINTLTLSNGTLHSRRFIEKTDGGAANITNIPVTGHPFLLEVDLIRWASTTDYITRQRFTNAVNGTYSYVRYCTSGTWGSWTTRKYTDTDTKVTSSANHYTPATASGGDISKSASGATVEWGIDVVKGVTLNTDGKGHVTGISVTSGKIPENPVPSNNVTGSGTSGYLTKWNGTNTVTNGPQLGSSTTTFLRNDGTWATPPGTYTHPTYTRTDTTSTASPTHGGTFTAIDSVTSTNGHVTAVNVKTVTLPAQYVHPGKTQTDTTSTTSPAHGGTFTVVDSVTRDTYGHVSGINVKTVTLPSDQNTDTKVKVTSNATTKGYLIASTTSPNGTAVEGIADTGVYLDTTAGGLCATNVKASSTVCANTANSTSAGGIALYSTDPEVYGIMFRGTSNSGKHGYVQSDWATYFTMNSGATTRGWIFRRKGDGNYASISGAGHAVFNGSVTVGGNSTNTSGCRMEYNSTTQTLDFVFV